MGTIQISCEELEEIIENKVREALIKAFMEITPYVDDKEHKGINEIAGSPENYRENEFES